MTNRVLPCIVLLAGCARASTVATQTTTPTLDRSIAPEPGPLRAYRAAPVVQHVLSNGLRVWIVERASTPLVEVRLVVDAGATRESAAQAGLASLTAALLTEGTTHRSGVELADQLSLLGAELQAAGTSDGALLMLSALARNVEDALVIFGDVLQNPALSDSAFERVRQRRLAALQAAAAQAPVLADQAFGALIYGTEHPYGRPPLRTATAQRALRNADVVSFYRAFYHPDNALLIVVGAVRTATLLPMLERTLQSWRPAGVRPNSVPSPAARRSDTTVYLVNRPASAQSELRVGYPAIARGDSAFAALTVANTVLGDYGRIWRTLRERRGYAYAPGSLLDARRFAGAWRAYAAVQTDATAQALSELLREVRELNSTHPVTNEELEAARGRILRNEPFAAETNAQVANRLQSLALQALEASAYDAFLQQLRRLTISELSSAIERVAAPPTIVVVGDRSRIEAPLRALGLRVQIVAAESPQ